MGVDSLTRAVFFDRDGVINQALIRDGRPFSPTNMDEFSWVDGIKEAARELKRAGYILFCATNQPDVGRGLQKRQVVESFHSTILKGLPLEKIYVCYHDDRDGCAWACCSKPVGSMGSIWANRGWSAIAGRTSMPAMRLGAGQCFSITIMMSVLTAHRITPSDALNNCHH